LFLNLYIAYSEKLESSYPRHDFWDEDEEENENNYDYDNG